MRITLLYFISRIYIYTGGYMHAVTLSVDILRPTIDHIYTGFGKNHTGRTSGSDENRSMFTVNDLWVYSAI